MTDRQTDTQTDARGKTISLPTLAGGDIKKKKKKKTKTNDSRRLWNIMIVYDQTTMDDHALLNGTTVFTVVKLTMANHGKPWSLTMVQSMVHDHGKACSTMVSLTAIKNCGVI